MSNGQEKKLEKILEQILHLDPQDKGAETQLEKLRDKQKFFNEGKVHFERWYVMKKL